MSNILDLKFFFMKNVDYINKRGTSYFYKQAT